ncbi:porin [Arenibaculum pallidiluteum]|uniref:porin n=1 Tax=Arenibaculum pallidiluteum TaxID=2812559 RepID=UPI001A966051|nr:porin [Arenibaculum pallidiluteum]
MKKILLGTAALLGTAVMAQGAAAQVTVKFGGDIRFDAAWIDDDLSNAKDVNFVQEVRFPISVEGKTDNGLTYGAFIRLRNSGSNHGASSTPSATNGENFYAERKYVYVESAFGRVEMGDEWGAVTKLSGFAPAVGIGQLDGDWGKWSDFGLFQYVPAAYFDRSTKVTYYTPRLVGVQAGVSYTPSVGQIGDNNSLARRLNTATAYQDRVELAANYKGEFGGFTVDLGGGYAFADETSVALDSYKSWNVSAAVGYAGFIVGGTYFDNNRTLESLLDIADLENKGWNAGVSYDAGPFALGVSYGRTNSESADGTIGDDSMWAIGGTYSVAPGLALQADVYLLDSDNAFGGTGNDATVVMLRTNLLF